MTYDDWKTTPPGPEGTPCAECKSDEARPGSNYCSESCEIGALHNEVTELRAALAWEKGWDLYRKAHLEQAAELLRRCERSGGAGVPHTFDLVAIHADMTAWWERDQTLAKESES